MCTKISKFREIIGDVDAFRFMLDGALKDWLGVYDVVLPDTNEYLFRAKQQERFRPFCRALRSKPIGEKLCWECDRNATARVATEGHPITYQCHAGLIDVAVPVIIDGKIVAAVLCGQVRSTDEVSGGTGLRKAIQLECDLGFEPGVLEMLWQQTPQIADSEIDSTKERIWKLITYVSKLGHERLELQGAHHRDQQRLAESKALDSAARDLAGLTGEWDDFWAKVDKALEQIARIIGAECGIVVVLQNLIETKGNIVVKALSGLPEHFRGRTYSFYDRIFYSVIDQGEIANVPFGRNAQPETICGSISQNSPHLAERLNEVVLARIELGDGQMGIVLFFLSKYREISTSLPIQEEKGLLVQLTSLLSSAYHHCSLYQARRRWLRQVTHQLLAPLHGLQGYAENAWTSLRLWEIQSPHHFDGWELDEVMWWRNSLESIVSSSHYAARLARNLAWVVYTSARKKEDFDFRVVRNVAGLLIRCARDFQGIARQRGLHKVEVDSESVKPIDGRLCVNDELFREAVGNLLDNAVKYADLGTDVIIKGEIFGDVAQIKLINQGIRLRSEELEKIFDYEYRTKEARIRHPAGTGIGLYVARQILSLHNGSLTAEQSEPKEDKWQTTFVMSLPIYPIEKSKELTL